MKGIILLRQWTWVESQIFYFPFVPFTAELDGWDRITPKFSFDNDKILWLEVKKHISQNIHCGRLGMPRSGHVMINGKLQMTSNIANR